MTYIRWMNLLTKSKFRAGYTGNPERDSELQSGSFLDLAIDGPVQYLFYLSGIPFWIDAVCSLIRHAFGYCTESYLCYKTRACRQVSREARIYLCLYVWIAVLALKYTIVATTLLRNWVWPALLAQPILRFYLLAEHRGRKQSTLVYENTRTTYTNWFLRRLAWCMPYHMEHHAWPSVPFYKLKDANHLLVQAAHEASAERGYDVLEQGEAYPELKESSRLGYIGFNLRFWKHLRPDRGVRKGLGRMCLSEKVPKSSQNSPGRKALLVPFSEPLWGYSETRILDCRSVGDAQAICDVLSVVPFWVRASRHPGW